MVWTEIVFIVLRAEKGTTFPTLFLLPSLAPSVRDEMQRKGCGLNVWVTPTVPQQLQYDKNETNGVV